MKKFFLFAAVAGMLASCSSESLTGSDPNIEPTQEERVPIEIGVASVQTKASTRGIGAVGDLVGDANNVWKGQTINAFMFDKGKLTIPRDEEGDIYNNTVLTTPAGVESGIAIQYLTPTTIKHKYYPQRGNFDFWGYYADDANAAAVTADPTKAVDATSPIASEIVDNDQDVIVPFVINGTQDLMVAKAVPVGADATAISGWDAGDQNRFYSAFAARKGIQPELTFKHLLTLLKFKIKGGTPSSCGWSWNSTALTPTWEGPTVGEKFTGVFVKSIKIKSQSTGYIVAAYTRNDMSTDTRYQNATKLIKFDDTTTAPATEPDNYTDFELWNDTDGDGKLDALYGFVPAAGDLTVTAPGDDHYNNLYKATATPTTATTENTAWTYDAIPVGSGILAQTRDSYVMEIELGQYLLDVEDTDPLTDADGDSNNDDTKYIIKTNTISDIPVVVDPTDLSKKFEIGKAYTLTITVYGNEEIKIKTTLEGWIDGGDVPVSYD